MKLKVSIFTSLGPPPYVGGIENVVDTLLHSRLADDFDFPIFDTYRVPDPNRTALAKAAYVPALAASCFSHLRRERPALVHIHFCSRTDFWKHSICLGVAQSMGIPVVFHLHGGSFNVFYDELPPPGQAAVRAVFRRPERVIALSEFWKDYLSTLMPPDRIRVLNNPIDCSRLAPEGSRVVDAHEPTILLLGSLGRRKGHYDVLRALPLVLERHPRTRVLFAGADEDLGATEELKRTAIESGVQEHVAFLGPVAFEPKVQLLQTASVMVLPSYGENMPISVLEGMAARMPIVASRVGAVPEMLDEGKAGILIDAGDWRGLADGLNQLLQDPEAAIRMGELAGTRARERWDVSSIANQLSSMYRELLPG